MEQNDPLSIGARDHRSPLTASQGDCSRDVREHYDLHPYPRFSYLASVRTCDTYALNVEALWSRANGCFPPTGRQRVLLAGCGAFSPYPTSLANPGAEIVALDLSSANLRRARLHALLHGRLNIRYVQGNLLDAETTLGPFSFIDCYGVLHHLDRPGDGLKTLERRIAPGGVIRVMVYSRQARQEEESIRRALRLLGVRDVATLKTMIQRAGNGSRFASYLRSASEARYSSGLADALLHPRVTTFTTDSLLAMCAEAGLEPLFFAHHGAVASPDEEILRLREAERNSTLATNFTVYLVRTGSQSENTYDGRRLLLNPVLKPYVGRFQLGVVRVADKLGMPNPPLDRQARAFLRAFRSPRPLDRMGPEELRQAEVFRKAMFLLNVR